MEGRICWVLGLSNTDAAIDAAEWVGDGDCGPGIGDPTAVHHKEVLISPMLQFQSLGPASVPQRDHRCRRRMPIVESTRDGDHRGIRIQKREIHRAGWMGLRITRRRVLDVGFLFHGHHSLTSERRREDAFGPRIACSVCSQFCEAVGSASWGLCGREQKPRHTLQITEGIAWSRASSLARANPRTSAWSRGVWDPLKSA
jgi:hypothetical protein